MYFYAIREPKTVSVDCVINPKMFSGILFKIKINLIGYHVSIALKPFCHFKSFRILY